MTNDKCPHRHDCYDYKHDHCDGCNLAKVKANADLFKQMTNKEAIEILRSIHIYAGEETKQAFDLAIRALEVVGEWVEVKHRLNLLIGVLYSNQLISHDDIEYIEDSIKKLMEGGAE